MAIDSRAKRQNVAHIGFPIGLAHLPTGTIDQASRAGISWTYIGITIVAGILGDFLEATVTSEMPSRTVTSELVSRTVTPVM
jgi:hypothetical protein